MWVKVIQDIAGQLCDIIPDYDVNYQIAKYYVQKRIEDSIEECRRYHINCCKNNKIPKVMREKKRIIALMGPPLSRLNDRRPIWGPISNEKKNTFTAMIRFMSSERGVRTPYWRTYAAAWGIQDLDKEKLTIRDKLNDMNKIPISIVKQIAQGIWVDQRRGPNFWYRMDVDYS
tara:strand:- start:1580 stop:2098 length:519 start_codon:yes stop_codon:yes gene_type:complete